MRTHLCLAALAAIALAATAGVAHAQPGAAPPPPPPRPAYYAPPPPAYYPPPAGLSAEDQRLLARGEISPGAHVGGGIVSLFFGLGLGQAVQGRWTDTGWIFTVGETASFVAILVGVDDLFNDCGFEERCNDGNGGLFAVGLIGLVGFRVWELVDAFAGPSSHNRKVRELRMRLGYPPTPYYSVAPFVAPTHNGGGVAGVTVRF